MSTGSNSDAPRLADELAELAPELTAVGGQATWDPQGRMRDTGGPP